MQLSRFVDFFRVSKPASPDLATVVELTTSETERVSGGSPKGGWVVAPGDGSGTQVNLEADPSPKGGW